MLYYNGNIYVMDGTKAAAVLTEGNKIKQVFNEMPDYDGEKFDLKGQTMLPGLVDTHIHLVGVGQALSGVNFSEDTDIEIIKNKIRTASASLPDDAWLICEGYDENKTGVKINKDILDDLAHQKVLIRRICRHAALVNSAALNALNIDDAVEDMEGGQYERHNGKLTGWVYDTAMEPFVEQSMNMTQEDLERLMIKATEAMHAKGLTGVHTEDLGYYNDYRAVFRAYKNVFGPQKLMRLNLLRNTSIIDALMRDNVTYTEWLKPDAMKLYADGALGGRTALFRDEYSDDPGNNGLAIYTQEALEDQVKKARGYDMNVAIHTIGDKAVEMVLDAIEKYPPNNGRDRLIHISFLAPDLIERISQLPVICDVQPSFVTSDYPWAQERVGAARAHYSYPWKTLMDKGVVLGGGSDAPIEDYNPLVGIDAAVNRRPFNGSAVFQEHERLTVFQAIQLYTVNAADIGGRPLNGLIKEGYLADFTILKEDPFTVDPETIHQIEVGMTIVDGEVVYSNQ